MANFENQRSGRETAEVDEPFSSTLSTREFLLVKNIGVTPVSQVMGTSFVRLPRNRSELLSYVYGYSYSGPRPSGGTNFPSRRQSGVSNFPGRGSVYSGSNSSSLSNNYNTGYLQPVTGEIYDLTNMRLSARQLAVGRMRQEAEDLGASGVIAVRMKTEVHNWGDCLTLECTAMGTAVAIPDWKEEKPFTSLMPAQQFWRLWQSGYQPCGIAIGACSYSDCAESSVLRRTYNQEVASYTASFYDAHGLAMEHYTKDVRHLKGIGAVGMEVEYEFEDIEKELEVREGVSMTYMHLITHFVVTGTAIRRREGAIATPPQRTLRILDLSNLSQKRQATAEPARVEADTSSDAKE
jgi:uncharacterized protein YbjQ (UPF0145 family)